MRPVVKVVGIVVAALIVAAIMLPLLVNANNFRPQIESSLSSALGRQVKLGNLSLSVLSRSVEADQFAIADDPKFSSASFIQARSLQVGVEMLPLIFSKQLNVTNLSIGHPQIALLRDPDGVWNFSSLGTQLGNQLGKQSAAQPTKATEKPISAPTNVNVAEIELSDATVTLGSTTGKGKPISYDNVGITVRNFSFASVFPVVVSVNFPGGGSLKIDGTAGPIDATDTSLTPVRAKVTVNKFDLSKSALVDPRLGVGGSADFDGTLTTDGNIAKVNGTLQTTALKLVPNGSPAGVPVQVVFAVEHDLKSESGKLVQADVATGKALAKLNGTYDMRGETIAIHTKLSGQAMPVDDIEGMLPALGVTLPTGSKLKGGMLSVELESDGPLDRLVSTGWVRMSNTTLAGFNLFSKLSAISALAGKQTGNNTAIKNLSADVRNSSEGTRLDKINVVIPSLGTVTGEGTIGSNHALDFKMVANLAGVGADLTRIIGAGSGGIPVAIGGTTSNPTFTPDMKGLVSGKLKGLTEGKGNPLGSLFGRKKSN